MNNDVQQLELFPAPELTLSEAEAMARMLDKQSVPKKGRYVMADHRLLEILKLDLPDGP